MHDGCEEASSRPKHPGGLPDGAGHVVDIHERHERDGEVDRLVLHGQVRGVRLDELELGAELTSGCNHLRRRIDPDHVVPKGCEIAAQSSLPAADVECESSGGRHKLEEPIAMKSPITIVTRLARPSNPVVCIALPRLSQHWREVCPSLELG